MQSVRSSEAAQPLAERARLPGWWLEAAIFGKGEYHNPSGSILTAAPFRHAKRRMEKEKNRGKPRTEKNVLGAVTLRALHTYLRA